MESSPAITRGEDRTMTAASRSQLCFWIVPHTHWDREWYLPFQVFRLRLVRTVDELMDTLEADPAFSCFTLDGQAVVLEDYLEARPASRDRLADLIGERRIRIGPSYVLPDEYLAGQELLVRNLLLGRRVCREFGREVPVAYYPDTFGHVAQMPQIIRGFGMESFVFWRGLGDESGELGATFRWRGPDGSEVLAIRQLDGYGAVESLGGWVNGSGNGDVARRLEEAVRRLKELHEFAAPYLERAGIRDLLAGNGTDHRPVQRDLPAILEGCRQVWPGAEFRIAGLEEYVEAVHGRQPDLAIYEGEMCGGKDAPVLRGVNSSRMWIKQRNEAVERALLEAEVSCSLAHLAGASYPMEDLRMAWFHLLRNHPHDSICGCSVDDVHRDMAGRFDAAEQLAVRLRREALWQLAGGEAAWWYSDDTGSSRTAVNLLPWMRRGVVKLRLPLEMTGVRQLCAFGPDGDLPIQLVQEDGRRWALVAAQAPGFGASSVHLRRGASAVHGARITGRRAIENEHYRVEVLDDGTLDVLHKPTGRHVIGAHWFEDEADRGDEYNFCPLEPRQVWDSRLQKARVRVGQKGPAIASLILEIDARLPEALRPDRKSRRRTLQPCRLQTEIRLVAGVDRVEFVTTFENRSSDHRFRIVFPTPESRHVRVEGHFAVLRRPVGVPDVGPGWTEPPAATHHTLGAVEAAGVAVFGRGLPEYEARPSDSGSEIAVTLLRSVGWLSREDLPTRPGHAGPGIPTPEAQCLGTHRFEYSLALVGEIGDADLVSRSQDYRFPLLAGPEGVELDGRLRLEGDGFCFSTLKAAEDGEGCVLRVYNPAAEAGSLSISGEFSVEPCRLDEMPDEVPFAGSVFGGRIATFRLRPQ
jgi:mannosylglycerate hydrolase